MEKFRYLFTLCLGAATLGSAQAASDDGYDAGDQVTDIAAVAADQTPVLLQSPAASAYSAGKYISPKGFTSTATTANLYTFEATGEEVDGYPTYRLKSVSNGKYLRAEVYGKDEDTSAGVAGPDAEGVDHAYTSDVSAAYTFTALQPTEANSSDPRVKVDVLYEGTWVFAENKEQPDGAGIGYFGTYYSGFMSVYTDTNSWYVYKANKLSGADQLAAYIQSAFPNALAYYAQGNGVGQVPSALYTALKTAYDNALTLSNTGGSDEECAAARTALETAKEAAEAGIVSLEDGKYYFFQSYQSGKPWAYADATGVHGSSSFTVPTDETATVSDAAYIWKAVAQPDGKWALQNYQYGTYSGENSNTSGQIPTSASPVALNVVYNSTNEESYPSVFNIYTDACTYHIDAAGNLVQWDAKNGGGCLFAFTKVSDGIVNALKDAVEQANLNTELSSLYGDAAKLYNGGRNFTLEGGTLDGTFDDAGIVNADALSTNAQEASEGPLADIADGDFTTYFHSTWHSGDDAPTTYHHIQADLGKAYSTFAIKYAKRSQNQTTYNPTNIYVYATNDVNGTWDFCGSYPLTYTYSAMVGDKETANFVGVRGIELGKDYRYVRLAVTEHQMSGGTVNGFPYFYLSELRFYPAAYSAENSKSFTQVDATVAQALADALTAAQQEVASEKATRATIDQLQAAYKAFAAQYPDAQILRDSIAEAKTFTSYPAGDELGYYPQSAIDALTTVITEVEGTVADGMALADIQSGVAKLREAVSTFKASLIMPEVGKTYVLRGMTTDANNTRALGAMIYSTGNSTTANLRSLEQAEDGTDQVDPADNLNYVWKVESNANGKISLRNLATGFYIGQQSSLNGAITNVPDPTEIGIQGISTGGGFNLVVGDGLYANFQGQGVNMVAWNTASGTDNSSIKFEEVTDLNGQTNWSIAEGVNQILTFPFSIMAPSSDEGTAYSVLGQKETDGKYTIELKTLTDQEIPAGMPFVFKPVDGKSQITLLPTESDMTNLTYVTEGQTTENGALTGVIAQQTITGSGKVLIKNGIASIIGNATSESNRLAAANAGYINFIETTETGDAQINLVESMTTGIAGTTIVDANAKVDVYTTAGIRVRSGVKAANATDGLPAGLYIVGGKKVIVK